MAPKIHYEKDAEKKAQEKAYNVEYDACGKNLNFSKQEMQKGMEDKEMVKYNASSAFAPATSSLISQTGGKSKKRVKCQKSKTKTYSDASTTTESKQCTEDELCSNTRIGDKPLTSKTEAKCYEVKRGLIRDPCVSKIWQNGKYCRDDCGSGIVANKYGTKQSRKLWCKTPLSMYQATVGELGRQILCREKLVPRDVKPGPPCNVCEYILPPCGGYYRKYDCLRPCEEDYAYYKGGKKCYRDRVERYWEPCVTSGQKYKMDVNDYAPQNVALGLKLRREFHDTPCW